MKEPYAEGPATHGGPESCGRARKDAPEALTGGTAGRVMSHEIADIPDADAVAAARKATPDVPPGQGTNGLAWSKTPSMQGRILREIRETR